jgi:hypothetical protein
MVFGPDVVVVDLPWASGLGEQSRRLYTVISIFNVEF